MRTCGNASAQTPCDHPRRAARDAGLTCPHAIQAVLRAVRATTDHVPPQHGHREFTRVVRPNYTKPKVSHTLGDLSRELLRRHRQNRRPKPLVRRLPSLSHCNGRGATPGQVSPLMNVDATEPQVPVQYSTHAPGPAGSHEDQVRRCLVVDRPGRPYRRLTFFTSPARACRKAWEAGQSASVTVAQLVPVAVVL